MKYLNVNLYLLNRNSMVSEDVAALEKKVKDILDQKISGISFSPYLEGQDSGVKPSISEKQIAERFSIYSDLKKTKK